MGCANEHVLWLNSKPVCMDCDHGQIFPGSFFAGRFILGGPFTESNKCSSHWWKNTVYCSGRDKFPLKDSVEANLD